MKPYAKLFKYIFIHTSLWLGFGAVGVALMSFVILRAQIKFEALIISFLATFFLYNLNKKTDIIEDSINYPERARFIKRYGKILFITGIFGYTIAFFIAFLNGIITLIITLLPFLLTFLYSVFRLKKIFLVKDIIVPAGWSMTPMLVISYTVFEPRFLILPLFIFLRSLIITICYDIKDIKGDKKQKIKTIPNTYGILFTKKVLYDLNLTFLLIMIIGTVITKLFLLILPILTIFTYSSFYLTLIGKTNIQKLCEIASAGEYIVLGLLSLMLLVFL